jgi:hypothetical protein
MSKPISDTDILLTCDGRGVGAKTEALERLMDSAVAHVLRQISRRFREIGTPASGGVTVFITDDLLDQWERQTPPYTAKGWV